ncbi:hypothetical protein BDE36_1102 [Arcticibacter tournemirensis]|uniref:Uncharacterized protein n=1 Tax=Arcticibacter tournemirensis TaxID=699437 RepID=A0A5M9GH17_9SPHI|nr:hypothetical protein [Arcticibacter tournemirensis]KAA8473913.1 hypothetical protein F1649_22515 [Arcticibacter tournemirensis]TQM49399.1 hypothetical protein BDE36_1102 [Arcticibacter tournemirensis]
MKKADIYKLTDLIEEVKKIDAMILLHQNIDESQFMVSQYEAKKTKLIGEIIDELAAPSVQSPRSFSLIQQILLKFYPPLSADDRLYNDDISKLAAVI